MKKLFAFSLVEVSIVILIVGVLIAGVSQGKKLLKSSKLSVARSLTQQSPVADIDDLALWYETTLDTSFIDSEAQSGVIGTWIDNNTQALKKNNATQGTAANKPLLVKDVFNGAIPAVRFDGTSDTLAFDGSILAATDYTIFVVEQRRTTSATYFMTGSSTINNGNLHLGYRNNTTITQAHWFNDMDYTVAGYVSPTPVIHSFWFSSIAGKKYWRNGGITPNATSPSQLAKLISYNGSALGATAVTGNYYNGDLAEIIIFTRALKIEEKILVDGYLSKKYNISTPAGTAIANSGAGGGSGNIGDASNATYVTCNVSIAGVATPATVNQGTGILSCNATDYTGTVNYTCNSAGTLTTSNNTCAAPHQYWEFIGIYYCTSNMQGEWTDSAGGSPTVVCDAAHHGRYASMANLSSRVQPTATNPVWTGVGSNTYFWWSCYCNNYDTFLCPPCVTSSASCFNPSWAPYGQRVYRCNYN